MIEEFEKYLRDSNLSENTIVSYLASVKQFEKEFGSITKT